jgi:hypothetical protein
VKNEEEVDQIHRELLNGFPLDRLVKWQVDEDEFDELSPRSRTIRSVKRDQEIDDILAQVQAH